MTGQLGQADPFPSNAQKLKTADGLVQETSEASTSLPLNPGQFPGLAKASELKDSRELVKTSLHDRHPQLSGGKWSWWMGNERVWIPEAPWPLCSTSSKESVEGDACESASMMWVLSDETVCE